MIIIKNESEINVEDLYELMRKDKRKYSTNPIFISMFNFFKEAKNRVIVNIKKKKNKHKLSI